MTMSAKESWLRIISAAYQLDVDDSQWLDGVARALRPRLDHGLGIYAYLYHATCPTDFRAQPIRFYGCSEKVRSFAHRAVEATTPEIVRDLLLAKTVGSSSEELGPQRHRDTFREMRPAGDIVDSLAVNAIDPTGLGYLVIAPLARKLRLAAPEKSRWSRISAPLAAAHRLRHVLGVRRSLDGADAIVDSRRSIQHAAGEARASEARAVLRDAALRIDRARLRRTRDPDEAIDLWRALVSGRWTIVDRFDTDGKRFFVAWRNDPAVPRHRRLTRRELQVASYASLGHSNKLIGYELGLSTSTVSTHLETAQEKLGVRGRLELSALIRAFRARLSRQID